MKYVVFFTEATPNPVLMGGKGSNIIRLVEIGANVPPGFIITTSSYIRFLEESEYQKQLKELLSGNPHSKDVLNFSQKIRKMILESKLPKYVKSETRIGFDKLKEFGSETSFAVRSSATIEDMDTFSFAGQGNTYLNNNSFEEILLSVRNCWASLFSPQALTYFLKMGKMGKKYSLSDIHMAVIVQKMVDARVSGVLFTANVINNNKDQMMINSTWGLGETIANNSVIPDMIILEKSKFKIVKIVVGKKEKTAIKNPKGSHTIMIDTDPQLRAKCSLHENQLRELHELGLRLEKALNSPQDVEWATENDMIYILQSRPITTLKS
nr:PEP/pyruvate-binding domain-containing protein [Candidatus Njordarchaeum guaymaensis]